MRQNRLCQIDTHDSTPGQGYAVYRLSSNVGLATVITSILTVVSQANIRLELVRSYRKGRQYTTGILWFEIAGRGHCKQSSWTLLW